MIEATAAIIRDNGRILIAQKDASHKLSGLWEFPGGKMEAGETPEESLIREISEELGLEIEVLGFYGETIFPLEHVTLHIRAYDARSKGGTLSLLEHCDARWVQPESLKEYPFVPSDQAFVDRLMSEVR